MTLDDAVSAATRRYIDAHPRSAELAERAARVMPGGNTRSVLHFEPFAFRVERADGAHLHDVDGHTYLDLLGDYSAGLLGRRREVAGVVRAVLDRGWSYGATSEPEAAFAEVVVARFPSIDLVRFTNSGTEANLMALLTARHATGRDRVVVFDGAYHGGLLNFTPAAAPLRAPFDFAVLPYNDVAAVEAEFAARGGQIASVLVEPMLGAAGCLPGDPAFLAALRRLTAASGTVLIFDEVMTSRLAVGGAQELLGITPDLTTLGKYLAGGLSFGAFGGRRDLMAAFDPRAGGLTHGGTFNNNAFTMAVGAAVHESLIDAATLAAVNKRGDALRDGLNDVFGDSPLPFSATGWGSFVNVHPVRGPINAPADLRAVDPRWRELFFFELLEAGFYLAPRGYLALTMDVTDDEVDRFLAAVGEFCRRNAAVIAFPGHTASRLRS
jgi:glutamate-1-semialdehyde 2,1-aminomutase